LRHTSLDSRTSSNFSATAKLATLGQRRLFTEKYLSFSSDVKARERGYFIQL